MSGLKCTVFLPRMEIRDLDYDEHMKIWGKLIGDSVNRTDKSPNTCVMMNQSHQSKW